MNKANRLVLGGEIGGRRVKIYEAASEGHADFVGRVSDLARDSLRFSKVLGRSGRFVICAWIEGAPLSRGAIPADTLARLARLQAGFHAADITGLPGSDFDYWRDVIAPRFVRSADLAGQQAAAARALDAVDAWRTATPATLNHPDLSLDNVILTGAGDLVPIDNELLHSGPGAFMDVLNTMNSLPADRRAEYLRAYRAAPGAQPLPDQNVLQAFWLARRAGTLFAAGRIGRLDAAFEAEPKPGGLSAAMFDVGG